jgi:hypothetical protein
MASKMGRIQRYDPSVDVFSCATASGSANQECRLNKLDLTLFKRWDDTLTCCRILMTSNFRFKSTSLQTHSARLLIW